MSNLFMGIDIGTSGVRAAIFNAEGFQISLFHKEYPLICLENGMAELDPDQVLASLIEVVGKCIEIAGIKGADIQAIGLSTQLFSFMTVDKHGSKLTNLITWADTRASYKADFIKQSYDCSTLYSKTGCRTQHPMYPLSKILWLRDTYPDLYRNSAKFISIKEYILYRLFNEYVIDITDASASACMNIHEFCWDEDILKNVLGVDIKKFGEMVECTHILKGMNPEYALKMNIDPDIPVAVGSGDGIMANVGCGVFDETSMSSTIGTSGALRIAVNEPLLDTQQRTWCYCFTRDTWVAGGAINNGGIVLKWLRDEYKTQFDHEAKEACIDNIYALFDKYAQEIKAGSDGLVFLPLLTGERSPYWNASAKGIMYGLQLSHGKKHTIRASMEGVMYRMLSIYEILTSLNNNVNQIIANGGYANSEIWLQIQADIFNRDIAVAGISEAAVFGAAYTSMAAIGAIKSLKEPLPCMKPQKVISPNIENFDVYDKGFKMFKDVYRKFYL